MWIIILCHTIIHTVRSDKHYINWFHARNFDYIVPSPPPYRTEISLVALLAKPISFTNNKIIELFIQQKKWLNTYQINNNARNKRGRPTKSTYNHWLKCQSIVVCWLQHQYQHPNNSNRWWEWAQLPTRTPRMQW